MAAHLLCWPHVLQEKLRYIPPAPGTESVSFGYQKSEFGVAAALLSVASTKFQLKACNIA